MIKINLLRALKEAEVAPGAGADASDSPLKAFFSKLFAGGGGEGEDFAEEIDEGEVKPIELVLKVIVIFLVVGGLYYHESVNIPKLRAQLQEENKKLQELAEYNNKTAAVVAEIKRLQEHKALIEKQIASMDGLSKVRLRMVRAMDLIQTNLPEKMWLLGVKSKEHLIEVSGISQTENEITQFLQIIGRSVFFADASMVSSEDINLRGDEGRKVKKFNLNFSLEVSK